MELIDIIDKKDQVVGKCTRDQIYEYKYWHRIVHVLVFSSTGKMLLQRRSSSVSYLPLYWTTSASGHVTSGEDYQTAAVRELEEELGIKSEINFFAKVHFTDGQLNKFLQIYKVEYDGDINFSKDDVDFTQYFNLSQIQSMILDGGKFHPELLYILNKFYNLQLRENK